METIWLEIDVDEVLLDAFIAFTEFLSINKMKYTAYYSESDDIVVEVVGNMTDEFNKMLSSYIYYQSIIQLDEEPKVSDIDIIEGMSSME